MHYNNTLPGFVTNAAFRMEVSIYRIISINRFPNKPDLSGSYFMAYVRREFSIYLLRQLVLDILLANLRLSVHMHNSPAHFRWA